MYEKLQKKDPEKCARHVGGQAASAEKYHATQKEVMSDVCQKKA